MTIFNYCSAPCGSGKTHQFINRAIEWANSGGRIIIFLPTKELIDKTIEHFLLNRPDAPPYRKFHGDVSGDVTRELTDHLKQAGAKGQIVFATHAVLQYLPHLAIRKFWNCFVDEAPQVFAHHIYEQPNPDNGRSLLDLITLEQPNAKYSRLVIRNRMRAELDRLSKDKRVDEAIRDIARILLNRNWQCSVSTQAFADLKEGTKSKLSFFSILMPTVLDGFATVTMASANFKDSFAYQIWNKLGVEFRQDQKMAASLRFAHHDNGHLVTIKYPIDRPWSKKLRKLVLDPNSETSVQMAYVAAIKAELDGVEFLYQANRDVPSGVFDGRGIRLPNVPHGLNNYSHINNIAFLSSLNPHPEVFPFLKSLGVDGEGVRRAIYYQAGYQSVLRTSIRDPYSQDPKTIVVPDRGLAEYLLGPIPGCKVEKLITSIPDKSKKVGRPRKYLSDNDRKAQHKRRKKLLDDQRRLQIAPYDSRQL